MLLLLLVNLLLVELAVYSMNMVKSRLLSRNTLSSTVIGVVPQEPSDSQVAANLILFKIFLLRCMLSVVLGMFLLFFMS